MMLIKTHLLESEIQGIGLYASEFVAKGTLIWKVHPKLDVCLSPQEIEELPAHMKEFVEVYSVPHPHRPGNMVVEADNGRFMNHSDDPNTDFKIFEFGYAIKDIKPGEELTCDYRELDPTFLGFSEDGEELYSDGKHVSAPGVAKTGSPKSDLELSR